ncbi:Metallo-beta-lactamase family protein, RNA-specific [Rubrivivax sp. A210]|uniref:MBL fold metallo-hydrolase RNA specificity domain-containing protein n=1 Tax=Rubrivivax sp. A210 TaxID=2772301 RepID=UPI0019198477|nr:MBL fold metallo-hydrolase [Rubrivivax sp. A210]CAD5373609.1 Metallo-beta-lactamase family protein, RNA-specific [Rubrivivax sp. A210]
MKIHFLGAADGVTGSRHLVESAGSRILLDCGMFQGWKLHRERNWSLPEALRELDAVVISHAHLDHSGWLPALVRHGYKGPVYASPATCALARVLLLDSAHLQEEDARRANRHGYSRHAKALPLYTRADAERALALMKPLPPGREILLGRHKLALSRAGHLLGACSVSLSEPGREGLRLVFSGDLGRQHDLLMPPPQPAPAADVMIVESTYGNRLHPEADPAPLLADIVKRTVQRGGSVLLPAFAVGRAQALLLLLQRLRRSGAIAAEIPIFLDSPMAQAATALYRGQGRLLRVPARELRGLCDGVRMVETAQQSMRLAAARFPAIIISASGMATGGRVLHHLKAMAPEHRHSIVLAGFQVGGSRGARLLAGERELRIHGEMVPVRAEVSRLEGLSGHADRGELLAWLGALHPAPRATFVVHGEPDAADALRGAIQQQLGWAVRVPQHGEAAEV